MQFSPQNPHAVSRDCNMIETTVQDKQQRHCMSQREQTTNDSELCSPKPSQLYLNDPKALRSMGPVSSLCTQNAVRSIVSIWIEGEWANNN